MGARNVLAACCRTTIASSVAITLAAGGCGGPGFERLRGKAGLGQTAVLQAFAPGSSDVVFSRAVRALEDRHFELEVCDPDRGAIRTAVVEHDAACGSTTCLARELVVMKVGWRAVRVEVRRVVFDGATRDWTGEGDDAAASAALRDAQALAEAATDPASPYGAVSRPAIRVPGTVGRGQCPWSTPAETRMASGRPLEAMDLADASSGSSRVPM